ncbi:MAG: hypothetical protein JST32_13415 [Bacteroidetes bacterium]|nr:hypothetical protein [Bacteroidota bacterium]
MKNFHYCATLLLFVTGLPSCMVFKNGPASAPLEARYKKLLDPVTADGSNAPIAINVVSSIIPDQPDTANPKTIMNLQGQGQRELISQYAKLYSKPADFQNALNTVFFKKKDDSGPIDFSSKSIAVTISVTKVLPKLLSIDNIALGDRLEMITMKFKLDDGLQGVYFKSWDRFKTQYGRFYIGSRSFTGNQELNVNPSVTLANTAAFSLGNYDTKGQYTEQDTISQQVVVSNGILNDHDFMIDQTGTPKTTLMGNTILNITVGSRALVPGTFFSFDALFADNKVAAASKVKMSMRNYLISDNSNEIKGTLTCTYRYRHIKAGDRTYGESDDTVQYIYGTITTPAVLITKEDLKPRYFYIHDNIIGANIEVQDIFDPRAKNRDLDFASNDEAADFLVWLKQTVTGLPVPAVKQPVKKTPAKKKKDTAVAGAAPSGDILFNGRYKLVIVQAKGEKPMPIAAGYSAAGLAVAGTSN